MATAGATDVFFDDFNGASLDTSRWLIAEKQWGGDNGGTRTLTDPSPQGPKRFYRVGAGVP